MNRLKKHVFYPLFAALCVLFGIYYVSLSLQKGNAQPVIDVPQEPLTLSVKDVSTEVLLADVSAADREDGDLSGHLIVESLSNFFEPGKCRVTYAVQDSAKNVSKQVRDLCFTDYTPPEISLSQPLIFSSGAQFLPSKYATASDCTGKNLSANIKMQLPDATVSIYAPGTWRVTFKVTDDMGGTSAVTTEVTVLGPEEYAVWKRSVQIQLSTYMIHLEKGASFDPRDYLSKVVLPDGTELSTDAVRAEHLPDTDTDGVYTVSYHYSDENGRKGTTQLVVVVGEGA